jgi:hypothetical protein
VARLGKKRSAEDVVLQQFKKRLASAEKHAETIHARKRHAIDVYHGRTDPEYGKERNLRNPKDWRSRLFPQVAKEHAELKIAELCGEVPEWDAKPRLQLPEYEEAAKGAERAVAYYLDLDEFDRTFRTATRRCVKEGTQYLKVVMVTDTATGKPRPSIIPIPFEDFLAEPTTVDAARLPWGIHRWKATLNDLRAAVDENGDPIYENLEDLAPNPGGNDTLDKKRRGETDEAFEARTTGLHTIHEQWTPYGVLAVANRSVVIRHDEDPEDPIFDDLETPFVAVRIIEDEDSLEGVSTMLGLDADQEAYWKFLNELVNAITLATRPPKLVDEELDPNAAKYAGLYPDMVLPARNGEQTVKILQDVANLGSYGMQQLLELQRDNMERSSGMNAAMAGMSNANSATESSSNLSQSKTRVRLEIAVSESDWGRVMRKFFSRIQQYCDREDLLDITGGIDVTDPGIVTRFSSKMQGERALRELRMNALQTIWESIVPVIQPGSIEFAQLEKLLQEMFQVWDIPDLGAIAKSSQEVNQEQLEVEGASMAQSMQIQNQYAPPAPPPAG